MLKSIVAILMVMAVFSATLSHAQPPKMESYSSREFGFRILYPPTWQMREPAPRAVFTIFRQDQSAGISVNVANFSGDKETVMRQMETKPFRDNMLSGIKQGFPDAVLVRYNKVSLGGKPANLYIVQYTGPSSVIVSAQILSIYQKRAYSINLESAKPSFSQNYREFEKIAATLEFIQ